MADRRLQVFHAVVKHGSFTRAADALEMTQPAVTFQIKQLEEQLNTRLFERHYLKVVLTASGQVVLGYAEKILALSNEMAGRVAEMSDQVRGALAIGACSTLADYALPKVLGEFNEQYPQVQLRLAVGNSESIQVRVAEGKLDIGIVGAVKIHRTVQSERIGVEELKVACVRNHPLAAESSLEARALLDYEYVSREAGSGTREAVEHYFKEVGVSAEQMKTIMELGSPAALRRVVLDGLGFAIVPDSMLDQEADALATIPLNPPLLRQLTMIMPKERFRSRTIAAFAELATRRLRSDHP